MVHIGNKTFDFTNWRIKSWGQWDIEIKIPFSGKDCAWFKHGEGEYRKRKVWVTVGGIDSNVKKIKVLAPRECRQ